KNANDQITALAIADFTHDGTNDLLLGAPGDSTNGSGAGAMYIVSGGSALTGEIDLAAPPGGLVIYRVLGEAAGDFFGAAGRAVGGDLNGDGFVDLLAGSVGSSPGGRTRAGSAWAKFGPFATNVDFSQAVGSAVGPSVVWRGRNSFDDLGSAVGIGNVTGTST